MANSEHLRILRLGVKYWNKWRKSCPTDEIDLSGADLHDCDFNSANFENADFENADLTISDLSNTNSNKANFNRAILFKANLKNAQLREATFFNSNLVCAGVQGACLINANLSRSNLRGADFTAANLSGSDLTRADLSGAIFRFANLTSAKLERAILVETDISNAVLRNTSVYGISTWDIIAEGAKQDNLIITPDNEHIITVDDLEIAQFIYLLLNNQKFRDVIETINSKAVLILGRFTDERKKILDAIRDELRNRNFLPILFDFEKPATRDLTETFSILANLSRFVIADLTDAKSLPQELSHIIPFMPNLPVIPIILNGQQEYAMFEHWQRYPWVLPTFVYNDETHLLSSLTTLVIEPVEQKVEEVRRAYR